MALAQIVTNKLMELDPGNRVNYILSSSIYASVERCDDVIKMRNLLKEGDVLTPSGWRFFVSKQLNSLRMFLSIFKVQQRYTKSGFRITEACKNCTTSFRGKIL